MLVRATYVVNIWGVWDLGVGKLNCLVDVVWHGDVHILARLIPIQS